VLISASATSPQLTVEPDRLDPNDEHGLFWRTCPSDELQGQALAQSVVGTHPAMGAITTVAALYIDDAYGQGLANVFQEAHGVSNTTLFPFDETTDWAAMAANVTAANPDAILVVAVQAARTVSFISAIAGGPLDGKPIYLTDGSKDASKLLDPSLPQPVKDIMANFVVGTAPASPSGATYNLFTAALQKDFGPNANDFSFIAQNYDAAYVGAYGLVWASKGGNAFDGVDVANGLSRLVFGPIINTGKDDWGAAKGGLTSGDETIDVAGISGPLDFDPAIGEGPAPIEIWRPTMALDGFSVIDEVIPVIP
jgi:branched-chain amino acid transport system substrate-binding protein